MLLIASVTIILSATGSGQAIMIGRSEASPRVSMDSISHAAWDQLLIQFVDDRGMVDYASWKSSAADMAALEGYVDLLSTAEVDANATKQSKLAFWINAYNAVTIHGILKEYPTSSIKNHVSRLGGYSIWKHHQLYVGGKAYSLDDMEHKLLRKMDEPRIHFAVVCASISCPRLLNRAYEPATLDQQLNENAHDFFAQAGNFRYDAGKRRVYLSALLKWYGSDFGPSKAKQLAVFSQYFPDPTVAQPGVKVSYQKYDWGLNEQK